MRERNGEVPDEMEANQGGSPPTSPSSSAMH